MNAAAPKVLVASADRLYADALGHLLEAGGCEVAGVAADGIRTLALARSRDPDAVIVVGDLPRIGPSALARQLRARRPSLTIVTVGGEAPGGTHHLSAAATVDEMWIALRGDSPSDRAEGKSLRDSGLTLVSRLTPRERQTFMLLARGLSREEIAARIGARPHTVRTHVQHVYEKLGIHDRVQLVRFAAEHGLIGQEDAVGEERRSRTER